MATPNYEKEGIFAFLKKLQADINSVFNEMKLDFEKNPPVSNIKERFLVNLNFLFYESTSFI